MTQTPVDHKALPSDIGADIPPDQRLPVCGDFDFTIHRDGTWSYHGSPIGRKPLVKLFASVLQRVGDEYWLVTPVEQGRITVEDAPFVAINCQRTPDGLLFTTNLDHSFMAGSDHPIRVSEDPVTGEPRPYVLVRPGLEALIARPVFYDLVDWAVERDGRLEIDSGGVYFPLGPAVG